MEAELPSPWVRDFIRKQAVFLTSPGGWSAWADETSSKAYLVGWACLKSLNNMSALRLRHHRLRLTGPAEDEGQAWGRGDALLH